MSKFYLIKYPKNLSGDDLGRCVLASDSEKLFKFIDVLRDDGYLAAQSLFPKEWEWYGEFWDRQNVLDAVPVAGPGFVVSENAFQVLKAVSCMMHCSFEFAIGDRQLHWINPVLSAINLDEFYASDFDGFPALLIFLDVSGKFCNEAFVDAWTQAGLTGCEFVPVDPSQPQAGKYE